MSDNTVVTTTNQTIMPANIALPITNAQFINDVFGEHAPLAHVCQFADDPNQITDDRKYIWSGDIWASRELSFTDPKTPVNQYICLSIN